MENMKKYRQIKIRTIKQREKRKGRKTAEKKKWERKVKMG